MATIVISLLIFGAASYIVYKKWIKKDISCNCSASDCPIKEKK